MYTVKETPYFQQQARAIWSNEERGEFIEWIAANALAGDVIPGFAPCAKYVGRVREWARAVERG